VLTTAKRVLIAEDHPAMREGLQRVVERDGDMIVIASAADGLQAVQLHLQLQPDVTLMDLQMPKLDGLGAVAAIREISPTSRFVVLTSYAGHARVRRALDYGASSFLLKTTHSTVLLSALREALRGRSVVDPGISRESSSPGTDHQLSTREIKVLEFVAAGNSNARIGVRLSVTEHAVKARIRRILQKLAAQDRSHAVTIARRQGFIDC
jgi:DNA-binding NarL/FixJ family response regulator